MYTFTQEGGTRLGVCARSRRKVVQGWECVHIHAGRWYKVGSVCTFTQEGGTRLGVCVYVHTGNLIVKRKAKVCNVKTSTKTRENNITVMTLFGLSLTSY